MFRRADAAACLVSVVVGTVALPATASSCGAGSQLPADRGVALGLHFEDDARYLPWLWEIARSGATSVSLVVSWGQQNVRATTLAPDQESTSDRDLRAAIQDARSLGLRVTLFPIITIAERTSDEWRGRLAPESINAWFDSYRDFLLHYARIAADEDVEVFSVGSELGSMEQYEVAWRELIATVRIAYPGSILYSANWDRYTRTPFWDAVDFIGVTGYYELQADGDVPADLAMAVDAWSPIIADMRGISEQHQRPIVFTEIGYTAQAGAAAHPWDYTASNPLSLAEQATLYDAARVAWCGQTFLHGIYFWNWFGDGGPLHSGYSPRNKPAGESLRSWFRGEAVQIP